MNSSLEHIIWGSCGVCFTLVTLSLLLPAFREHARWRPGNAPMSLRSRVILPFFPLAGTFIALDVVPGVFLVLALISFVLGWFSYRADDRAYDRRKNNAA